MVPMHGIEVVGAFHEPENPPRDSEGLTRFRFMVPMHAEKNRKGALHEPHQFQVHSPVESGGDRRTLQDAGAWLRSREDPPGFWSAPPLRRFGFPTRLWPQCKAEEHQGLIGFGLIYQERRSFHFACPGPLSVGLSALQFEPRYPTSLRFGVASLDRYADT